jgi:hypothetical protein
MREPVARDRQKPPVVGMPKNLCATASVISSLSLICGDRPVAERAGKLSPKTRASTFACTRPVWSTLR